MNNVFIVLIVCLTVASCLLYTIERIHSFLVMWIYSKYEYQKRENEYKWKVTRFLAQERRHHDNVIVDKDISITNKKSQYNLDILSGLVNSFGTDLVSAIHHNTIMGIDLSDYIRTIDEFIDREFEFYVTLPRAGKENKPPVENVSETTKIIAGKIMEGLSTEFFDMLKQHGISEEYIMSYITRAIFAKIIYYSEEIRKKKEV